MRSRSPSIYSADDPLAFAIRPPESETEEQRLVRTALEMEARRNSDLIDEEIRVEREKIRRRKATGEVKLLLLGQAESGKSTLQKQFQLMHAPASLDSERSSWSTVVFLNIVKSIRILLESLEGTAAAPEGGGCRSDAGDPWRHQLANLRLRLSPLVGVEASLASRLSGGGGVAMNGGKGGVFVRRGWQSSVASGPLTAGYPRGHSAWMPGKASVSGPVSLADDPIARMLEASKDDIKELWQHPSVRTLVKKRRLRLDDSAEFFLNNIDRIATVDYLPSTDDIMRARIQTMGIAEHEFEIALGPKAVKWLLYDVGGARGLRHTWIPYFDDANAIIFLAPISAFDQYLDEDTRTNRIDDSLQLFTQICSTSLLKRVHMVLFLNKTDLLKTKLEAGIRVKRYITSFADRSNDYEEVTNYFKAHFAQVHRRSNEAKRVLYIHLTSVVDTKATQQIIVNVRDSIFRGYLKDAALV
ncbi:guanine nucleotide binding protein alpha subunit [Gautieria morchelliformis]|nr:guanine nucleotide binding protein alpha subunit [Gautieria morchelliformis]